MELQYTLLFLIYLDDRIKSINTQMSTLRNIIFRLSFLVLFFSSAFSIYAQQGDSLLVPRIYSQGHYYTDDLMKEMSIKGMTLSRVNDGASHKILVIGLREGETVPKGWGRYEIEPSRVANRKYIDEQVQLKEAMDKATHVDAPALVVGQPLPGDFSLKDLDGNTWAKDSLRGKKVVVNVWYSGCGPCRREMPALSQWKSQHPEVTFLSADFEKAPVVRKVITQHSFNWTHLVEDNYFTRWIGNQGFPLTIVIGSDGNVGQIFHGAIGDILETIKL